MTFKQYINESVDLKNGDTLQAIYNVTALDGIIKAGTSVEFMGFMRKPNKIAWLVPTGSKEHKGWFVEPKYLKTKFAHVKN